MDSRTTGGDEWQMAGKAKSAKPKPKQSVPATGETKLVNGHASGHAGYYKNDNPQSGQNGLAHDGGNSRRGGRQSSASSYGGRTNHSSGSQYSRPTSSKEDAFNQRKLLEKDAKNISKREAAVDRVGRLLDEEVEKSRDTLRQVFEEIRNQVNEREKLLLEELDNCKKDGWELLQQQEKRGKDMQEGVKNMAKMNDRQVSDLRNQLRRFMTDHRFEDDLSKPMRFRCEIATLLDAVKNFGEVVAIGGGGNGGGEPQKHSSMSSLVSSVDGDGVNNKPVSEVVLGGIVMKSDSMNADQLAELTRSLRENLKLQGIAEDILPDVSGSTGITRPMRRRPGGEGGGENGALPRR